MVSKDIYRGFLDMCGGLEVEFYLMFFLIERVDWICFFEFVRLMI